MTPSYKSFALATIATASLYLAACGGESPSSASNVGVALQGTVLGYTAAADSVTATSEASSRAALIVTVRERPGLSTTVSSRGTFSLQDLPVGSFTITFSQGGVLLGSVTFADVSPGQQITIVVRLSGSSVTLVEDTRIGVGHGDLEIEGTVERILSLNPSGESRFLIRGRTVVVRAGETKIREGGRTRGVLDITVGRRVHVKGVLLPFEGSVQPVRALEVKLQGPGD